MNGNSAIVTHIEHWSHKKTET